MSRLIKITPDAKLEEPKGFEFGYYAFEDLETIQTSTMKSHIMAIHQDQLKHAIPDDITVEWGLTPKQIIQAQQKDRFCKEQNAKILKGFLPSTHPYYMQDGILMK